MEAEVSAKIPSLILANIAGEAVSADQLHRNKRATARNLLGSKAFSLDKYKGGSGNGLVPAF